MLVREAARQLMDLYPRIFHACHTRHVRDSRTRRVLSAHQASILDHLDSVEPTSLSDLAAHNGVTPSTMSISIDRLVRGGYVLRVRDKADGRRVNLRLSPAGVRIKQAQSVLDVTHVRSLVSRLSPAERTEAIRGLSMLAGAAQVEMHSKVLYRLRSGGRSRKVRPDVKGAEHAQVDADHPGDAGAADRDRGDRGGPAPARPRRDANDAN